MKHVILALTVTATLFSQACGKKEKEENKAQDFSEFFTQYYFPERAFQVAKITRYDDEGEENSVETFEYDSDKNIIEKETLYKSDDKMKLLSRYEYTYNDDGKEVTEKVYDLDDDDKEYVETEETHTYVDGKRTKTVVVEYEEDGTTTSTETTEYDSLGRDETVTLTVNETDKTTTQTCDYESSKEDTNFTCTTKLGGTVQEEEVHKDLKSVVTSFVNSTKGVDISTTTYMEENNYLAAKIEEVDEEDESTTVAECTLDKDEYVCEEIVKDENNKITDKTVRTSSVSVHRIKTDAFTVDDYPLLLTTKRESTDYDADEKVTDVTIVEYTYNDQKLEVTSVDDDTENVGEDDEEQTVDESETTYDNDGRRPLETVTKRTKGEGKPYETKVEYEY